MIYTRINESKFIDSFTGDYANNFTVAARRALFNYIEQYSEETTENVELDIIELCCEFSEYESAIEAASNYNMFEGMTYDPETGGELKTLEEVEQEAINFLEENTTLITFDGGVLIRNF